MCMRFGRTGPKGMIRDCSKLHFVYIYDSVCSTCLRFVSANVANHGYICRTLRPAGLRSDASGTSSPANKLPRKLQPNSTHTEKDIPEVDGGDQVAGGTMPAYNWVHVDYNA